MKSFCLAKNEKNYKRIRLVSEVIDNKKRTLLGHIIRMAENEADNPLYQVTFNEEGMINVYRKRRVGRPRGWWAEDAMNSAMKHLQNEQEFDRDDMTHHIYLFSEVIRRIIQSLRAFRRAGVRDVI